MSDLSVEERLDRIEEAVAAVAVELTTQLPLNKERLQLAGLNAEVARDAVNGIAADVARRHGDAAQAERRKLLEDELAELRGAA